MRWRERSVIIWLVVCLAILLAAAFYLRSQQLPPSGGEGGKAGDAGRPASPPSQAEVKAPETNGQEPPSPPKRSDYYTEQRLERDRIRSQVMDTLREIIHNPNSDEGNRREAHARLLQLSQQMAKETEIEGLIKAKDFPDALVVLHQDAVHVLVKVQEITAAQAAQIGDIVATATGLPREKIIIDTKP
jgi:stage III sporulation protein AH